MFKVMTWNVENLFRSGADDGPESQGVYETKLEGLAATINTQVPDAVGLQEVGDPDALSDLVAQLDGDWHRRVSSHEDGRGIRVAWISPRSITEPENVINFPAGLQPVQVDDAGTTTEEMGRGAVAITVQSDSGQPVRLLTAHLKSKLLTFPGGRFAPRDEGERARFAAYALNRRAAEAATLRVWAMAALGDLGRDRAVIVTGDLNDTVQAATTQMLLGPPGSEIGTPGFERPDQGDQQRLWNLAPRMPAGKDYSRKFQGREELIDHILVSAALVRNLDAIRVEAVIDQPLPSISTTPSERQSDPSSDHAPVVASFSEL
jgi:endonuclease/exonuclease/phosphatase family metal-dependent hydrolase